MTDHKTIEELRAHIASLEQTASLGFLISAVVHEVNNPLSVMLIGADQLRHGRPVDQAVHRHLDALNQQSERIITISQRLQELGRRNLSERRAMDLRDLLRTYVELDTVLEPGGGAPALQLPDAPLPVEVNPAQVLQVLRYLGRAARRIAEASEVAVAASREEIPLIAVGPAAARSPMRTFGVVRLTVGEPAGEPVPYKELVPDFFSEPRPPQEVELMASWEVIRKLAGKLLIRSRTPGGVEIQMMVPLQVVRGDATR